MKASKPSEHLPDYDMTEVNKYQNVENRVIGDFSFMLKYLVLAGREFITRLFQGCPVYLSLIIFLIFLVL